MDAPEAPTSTAKLPPATAPRDGEPGTEAPEETLVVPPAPPEDARVAVDDGLFVRADDLRLSTSFRRDELVRQPALDLDSFLDRALVPGLVWLPRSAGRALPTSRGHRFRDVAIVVDDVPLIEGSVTESIGLLAPARLTFSAGPRASSPVPASLGGELRIDTGGSLDDVGETLREDGVFGAGYGGPDNEKAAFALARSGWRTVRVIGHATLLQREDFRTGRLGLGAPPGAAPVDSGSVVLLNTGGIGGTAGARVDVVPFDASRLFVSWQAGRSLDNGDPVSCTVVDDDGQVVDCERARERGTDVVIAGFDVRRSVFGLSLQPSLRVHAQRSVDDRSRAGSGLAAVDAAVDNVIRGGGRVAVTGSVDGESDLPFVPTVTAAVDVFADRYDSQFTTRSLRARDAEPAPGINDETRATFVDDATARTGVASVTARADSAFFDVAASARAVGQFVDAAEVVDRSAAVATAEFAPAADVTVRAHVFAADDASFDVLVSVGHVERPSAPRALLAIVSTPPEVSSDSNVEVGGFYASDVVEAEAVVYGSARVVDRAVENVVGVEGRATLKPGLDGLRAQLVLAGHAKNDDAGSPVAGVLQPQGGLVLRYEPTAWPAGFFVRVAGALPQGRLSDDEQLDRILCPERPVDETLPQNGPCSGARGFATVDVGGFVQLGQLRFDASFENLTDTQGSWRNAVLGTGGAAARARVAFFF